MLRPYQQAAVTAVYDYLRRGPGNPCVVLPTGAGKTHVIRQIVCDAVDKWGGRVLILAHVKELLEQAADKLQRDDVGIYSAGLKSRQVSEPIIIAGIQSVFKRACDLGPFNLIIIDEAHLLPPDGEGMYRTFLGDAMTVNPGVRLIGLTATPYRTSTGMICGPNNLLTDVCYEASIPDLIVQGYLCPLRSKGAKRDLDMRGVKIRKGDFVADDLEKLMDSDANVDAAVSEIRQYTRDRKSCIIFAAGVRHAWHLQALLEGSEVITGDTPSGERAKYIADFRAGTLKYLINVNVLSVGFDAPNVDCIALLRPTLSPGLYYQQVGRGLRICDGKQDCLVLDFAGNVKRHGPIDQIEPRAREVKERVEGAGGAPVKTCPKCQEICAANAKICQACQFVFPPKHNGSADELDIIAAKKPPETVDVRGVTYHPHTKSGPAIGSPRTLRVEYQIGLGEVAKEWVCIEHTGYAREKARKWWGERSHDPFPENVDHAVLIGKEGGLRQPTKITVQEDGKWLRIVGAHFADEIPAPTFLTADDAIPKEIPF
jgi:DNA repair protein RadD